MAFWNWMKRAFGGGPSSGGRDDGIYVYVRCDRCADSVRVRINPTSELQQEFGESGEGVNGYFARKMVIDQKCFRPIEVRLRFDAGRRERSREIEGGTFLTREEFEAAS